MPTQDEEKFSDLNSELESHRGCILARLDSCERSMADHEAEISRIIGSHPRRSIEDLRSLQLRLSRYAGEWEFQDYPLFRIRSARRYADRYATLYCRHLGGVSSHLIRPGGEEFLAAVAEFQSRIARAQARFDAMERRTRRLRTGLSRDTKLRERTSRKLAERASDRAFRDHLKGSETSANWWETSGSEG